MPRKESNATIRRRNREEKLERDIRLLLKFIEINGLLDRLKKVFDIGAYE